VVCEILLREIYFFFFLAGAFFAFDAALLGAAFLAVAFFFAGFAFAAFFTGFAFAFAALAGLLLLREEVFFTAGFDDFFRVAVAIDVEVNLIIVILSLTSILYTIFFLKIVCTTFFIFYM
jgi:hypothetical protein